MKTILVLAITLAAAIAARAQLSYTNLPPVAARAGLGLNSSTHQILEFANVSAPINNTLGFSVVGVRFKSPRTYQYGGGTLNAGYDFALTKSLALRPAVASGALYNGNAFSSFTAGSADLRWAITKNLSVSAGIGIGYLTSQKGFDALAGLGLAFTW